MRAPKTLVEKVWERQVGPRGASGPPSPRLWRRHPKEMWHAG
jgi:hypothetical protein